MYNGLDLILVYTFHWSLKLQAYIPLSLPFQDQMRLLKRSFCVCIWELPTVHDSYKYCIRIDKGNNT